MAANLTVSRTACRLCAVGCGILVELDGDRVVKVGGDPDDPTTAGYTCAKGRAAPELHHSPRRFGTPMVRRHGELVATTWDDALDDIAATTRAVLDAHGPGAVADYTGTGGPLDPAGYAMAQGFFRALGTNQHYSALSVDCPAKALVPQLVAGVQLMFQPDLDNTGLLLAVGVNTVVSHGHGLMTPNPLVRLRALRARGGRLVVVDPRATETARHADLHVALRPGTDAALLAYVVREVLRDGAAAGYLAACADPGGVRRLEGAVAGFDRARVASVCDVDEGVLDDLVRMVRAAGPVGIETGTGTSMQATGTVTEWLAWALAAVTGSLDRRGGNTFNPGFLRPLEDALPAGRGDLGPGPAARPDLRPLVNGEMPCAALADQIEAGHVRALFVRIGNPAAALPDSARVRAALARLDLLVAIEAVPTQTTDVATHVLPLADHFERGDLLTGYLQAQPFARWAPAVVAPVAERRAQWWVFAELSRRLGLPLFASARRDAALAGTTLTDEVVTEAILGGARRPWAEVRAATYGVREEPLEPGWLIPGRLPQRLDLAPAELVDGLAAAVAPRSGDGLVLVNRRVGDRYNSLAIRPGPPTLQVHPADAEALGLRAGGVAEVSTATGSCTAPVEVTDRVRPGVVSLPHGAHPSDVNRLTSAADVDPVSGMPVFSGFAVAVRPAPAGTGVAIAGG